MKQYKILNRSQKNSHSCVPLKIDLQENFPVLICHPITPMCMSQKGLLLRGLGRSCRYQRKSCYSHVSFLLQHSKNCYLLICSLIYIRFFTCLFIWSLLKYTLILPPQEQADKFICRQGVGARHRNCRKKSLMDKRSLSLIHVHCRLCI